MRGYLGVSALRGRKRRSSESATVAHLQLTSLIDIFTVLLLFLLKSLVVGGAVVSPFPGVSLPPSSSTASFKESPVVVVAKNQIVVDGEAVCATDEVIQSQELKVDAILVVSPQIPYKDVVSVMDQVREAGFGNSTLLGAAQ